MKRRSPYTFFSLILVSCSLAGCGAEILLVEPPFTDAEDLPRDVFRRCAIGDQFACQCGTVAMTGNGQVGFLNACEVVFGGETAVSLHAAQQAGPQIAPDGVVTAASFRGRTHPGGGIAQGSIFSIFGSNIGPSPGVSAASFPLDTTLAGVSITITGLEAEGTVQAIPLFVSTGQINAIMPSNAPLGFASITVTVDGVESVLEVVQIVPTSIGIFTATGSGTGPGSVTNFVSNTEQPLNTVATPARPGQFVTIWGTGLGGIDGPDNQRPADVGGVLDLRKTAAFDSGAKLAAEVDLKIYIGGTLATNVFYAGRSAEFPGLDQIIAEIPAGAALGCSSSLNVIGNDIAANGANIALSADGAACQPEPNLWLGDTIEGGPSGVFWIGAIQGQLPGEEADTSEIFHAEQLRVAVYAAEPLPTLVSAADAPPAGTCTQLPNLNAAFPSLLLAGGDETAIGPQLDVGDTVTVTRFDGAVRELALGDGSELLPLGGRLAFDSDPAEPLFLEPGAYSIGLPGGADIGPIQIPVEVPEAFTWTDRDLVERVPRDADMRLAWTGGRPGATVLAIGTIAGENGRDGAFSCAARSEEMSIVIPARTLGSMPRSLVLGDSAIMLVYLEDLGPIDATGIVRSSLRSFYLDIRTVIFE